MYELFESICLLHLAQDKVLLTAAFDEYNLDLHVRYRSAAIDFADVRPEPEEILEDEAAVARLSGFLIRGYADRVKSKQKGDECRIPLHFEH